MISTEVLALLNVILGAGIGWVLRRSRKTAETLEEIKRGVAEINGSVRELRQWAKGHEKLDDERFTRTEQTHRDIWEAIARKR